MGDLRVRAAPSAAFNLTDVRARAIDRAGALPLIVAPAEVLDDPLRVADRLAVDRRARGRPSGRSGPRPRRARRAATATRLLGLDPAAAQLARDASARAQAVRRRLAAVQPVGSIASGKIGSCAMSAVAVVTDTTHYLPRRGRRARTACSLVSLYVNWDGRTDRESRPAGLRRLLRAPRRGGELPTHVAAVRRRLPGGLRAADRGGDDIVSIHLSGGISGTVARRRAGPRRARRARRGPGADRRARLRTGCAGHGLMAMAAANAAAGGAGRAGGRRRGAARCARAHDDLVRGRHARVPAPRRAHRRRAGVPRLGAADQADPHDRQRDRADRARAHRGPRGRAARTRALRERTRRAPTCFVIQHIQAPSARERLVERGREIFGREPSSSRRSGRSSARTSGPACSA